MVLQAQKRLCALASGLLKDRETRLDALDEAFHAAQAKKRRRKVRAVGATIHMAP